MKIQTEEDRHRYEEVEKTHKIILRGNYKWHPFTDVELEIVPEGFEDKGR